MFFRQSAEPVRQVLCLDLDDTITSPERYANKEYVIQPDGHINARLLDKEKFARLVRLAIQHNIPIHIITARPDIPASRNLIESIIQEVNGFHSSPGGFDRLDYAKFAGRITKDADGNNKWEQVTSKLTLIETLRQTRYPHLKCEDFLFVDDMQAYLDPAHQHGYRTLLANPQTLAHFDEIEKNIISYSMGLDENALIAKRRDRC